MTNRQEQRRLFSLYAAGRFYSRGFMSAARGRAELGLFDTVTTLITLAGAGSREVRTAAIAKQRKSKLRMSDSLNHRIVSITKHLPACDFGECIIVWNH